MSPTFAKSLTDAAESLMETARFQMAMGNTSEAQRLIDLAEWHLDWAEDEEAKHNISEAA